MEQAKRDGHKKMPLCHGGALDPFATGLVLILAGQATRLMDLVHTAPKSYVATIRWGVETDNGDPLGQAVFTGNTNNLSEQIIEQALATFVGWQQQVPPVHSNKKVDGERAYKRVLRGEQVTLPPSRVYLHAARFRSHNLPHTSELELTCRGGYYVRALARDLGKQLGSGAHLATLHRTAIGPYADPHPNENVVVQGKDLLPWCQARQLEPLEAVAIAQGQSIAQGDCQAPTWTLDEAYEFTQLPIRALYNNRLVALLHQSNNQLTSFANLRGGL